MKLFLGVSLYLTSLLWGDAIITSASGNGSGTLAGELGGASDGDILTFHETLDGQTIVRGFVHISLNKAVTVDASSLPNGITFSGNRNTRLFQITNAGDPLSETSNQVVFKNVTFSDGKASVSPNTTDGAALKISNSNVRFENCHFRDNWASGEGGAICSFGSLIEIDNCTFRNNTSANAGKGGALFQDATGVLSIQNSSFTSNINTNLGAAVYNSAGGVAKIESCLFSENAAGFGAGIYNASISFEANDCIFRDNSGGAIHSGSNSISHTTKCTFENNSAFQGGAISNNAAAHTITECVFSSNSARYNGGAVGSTRGSETIITNSQFLGNKASVGGALYNTSSTIESTNCVFQGNSASSAAGALWSSGSAPSTFVNCTFQGNSSSNSGAVRNSHSSPSFTNCIVWANTENGNRFVSGASIVNSGDSSPTYSNCLFENIDLSSLQTSCFDGTNPSNNPKFFSEVDPLLAPVSKNGDLRLRLDSPLLNAGSNEANTLVNDIEGQPRIQDNTIDLGAFERDSSISDDAILWTTDYDSDASPYGIEVALGTDPQNPDLSDSKNLTKPTFDTNGYAQITFGRNPLAPSGTVWILTRSTTLNSNEFNEIYRFDGTTATAGSQISSTEGPASFTIHDQDPPPPRAFYRLEAELQPQSP